LLARNARQARMVHSNGRLLGAAPMAKCPPAAHRGLTARPWSLSTAPFGARSGTKARAGR